MGEQGEKSKELFLREQNMLREQYVKPEKEKKAASRGPSTERGRSTTPSTLPRCISPDISQSELRRRYEEQQNEARTKFKDEQRLGDEQKDKAKREFKMEQQRLQEQYKQQEK